MWWVALLRILCADERFSVRKKTTFAVLFDPDDAVLSPLFSLSLHFGAEDTRRRLSIYRTERRRGGEAHDIHVNC